jgi:hypothetical protein
MSKEDEIVRIGELGKEAQRILDELNLSGGNLNYKNAEAGLKGILTNTEKLSELNQKEFEQLEKTIGALEKKTYKTKEYVKQIEKSKTALLKQKEIAKELQRYGGKALTSEEAKLKLAKKFSTFAEKDGKHAKSKIKDYATQLELQKKKLEIAKKHTESSAARIAIDAKIAGKTKEIDTAKGMGMGPRGGWGKLGKKAGGMMGKGLKGGMTQIAGKANIWAFIFEGIMEKMRAMTGAYMAGSKTMAQQGTQIAGNMKALMRSGFQKQFSDAMEDAGGKTTQLVGKVNQLVSEIYSVKWQNLAGKGGGLDESIKMTAAMAKLYGYSGDELNKLNITMRDMGQGGLQTISDKLKVVKEIGDEIADLDIGIGASNAQRMFISLGSELRQFRVGASDVADLMKDIGSGFKSGELSKLGFNQADMKGLVSTIAGGATSGNVGLEGYLYNKYRGGEGSIVEGHYSSRYGEDFSKNMGKAGAKGYGLDLNAIKDMDVSKQWKARFSFLEDSTKGMQGAEKIYAMQQIMAKNFGVTDEKTQLGILSQKDKIQAGGSMDKDIANALTAKENQAENVATMARATSNMEDHMAVIMQQIKLIVGNLFFALLNLIRWGFNSILGAMPGTSSSDYKKQAQHAKMDMLTNFKGMGKAFDNMALNVADLGDKSGFKEEAKMVYGIRNTIKGMIPGDSAENIALAESVGLNGNIIKGKTNKDFKASVDTGGSDWVSRYGGQAGLGVFMKSLGVGQKFKNDNKGMTKSDRARGALLFGDSLDPSKDYSGLTASEVQDINSAFKKALDATKENDRKLLLHDVKVMLAQDMVD